MLGYATSMRTVPTTQPDTAIVNANLGMVAMGAAEMTTTTEFNEADMVLALEAAGYTTYGPAEEQACKLAQIVLAASRKKLMEQEPVGVTDMTGGIYWKRGAPIQAKLYAAPMPQANESEAVKALRALVNMRQAQESIVQHGGGHNDWGGSYEQVWDKARAVLAGELGAKDEQPAIDCLACAVRNAQLEQTPNSEVTAEYLDWLRTDCRSEGVGGNEAWNAGVAWARANATAEQPKQAQATDELIAAALSHAEENATHAALIAVPNTTPTLFVVYGE